jgi:hypothetical protein
VACKFADAVSVLFDVNDACAITRVHAAPTSSEAAPAALVNGDVVVSIDSQRVEGATAVRSALRVVTEREAPQNGRVDVVVWRPPADWVPPQGRPAPRTAPTRVQPPRAAATAAEDPVVMEEDLGEDEADAAAEDFFLVRPDQWERTDPIEFVKENPKKANTSCFERFAKYKDTKTVAGFYECGAWPNEKKAAADLLWDFNKKFVRRLPQAPSTDGR